MSRKKKLFLNITTGLIKQIIMVACGFILPRYMLLFYGSTVNGLVSSISHFLGFISFLDLGVGAVVQSNLYAPLAKKDSVQVSRLVKSSERFFRRLACIFLGYILVLCFVFPSFVNSSFDIWFTVSLIIIMAISTLAQFLLGITYQILLNADQKSYVQLALQTGTIILNTVFAVILMELGAGIHMVKLASAAVFILKPIGLMFYVHKNYQIDRKIEVQGEPIRQKWNGFSQHVAYVVLRHVDIVALTMFSTLKNVSVYSVYFLVARGVTEIIMRAVTGLEALFGNMLANHEREHLLQTFETVEWLMHNGVTLMFTCAGIMIIPFIKIFTKGVTDADYVAPIFSVLLLAAYAARCLRIPYFTIIKAAGHFKETQNGAFISAALNIIITFVLVFKFDLIGAASGTLIAMMYHTCYFIWYLRRNILVRPANIFSWYLLTDVVIAVISYFLTKDFLLKDLSYPAFIIMAAKVLSVVITVSFIVNLVFYRKKMQKGLQMIKNFKRKKKNG